MPSHYDTLQVIPTASDAVIKAAYRALAQLYHPDLNPGNAQAEALMKDINHAYQILSNTTSRAQFDIQQGLSAGSASVGDVGYPLAEYAHSPEPQTHAFPAYPAQAYESPQHFFRDRNAYAQIPNWPLRIILFGATAIFCVMAVAKWVVIADADATIDPRKAAPEMQLRMDKQPLIVPES